MNNDDQVGTAHYKYKFTKFNNQPLTRDERHDMDELMGELLMDAGESLVIMNTSVRILEDAVPLGNGEQCVAAWNALNRAVKHLGIFLEFRLTTKLANQIGDIHRLALASDAGSEE